MKTSMKKMVAGEPLKQLIPAVMLQMQVTGTLLWFLILPQVPVMHIPFRRIFYLAIFQIKR